MPLKSIPGLADKSSERVFLSFGRGIEMSNTVYDCNCDVVIEMQEMGVGVEEILQYVRGVLSAEEIRHLQVRLKQFSPSSEPAVEQFCG